MTKRPSKTPPKRQAGASRWFLGIGREQAADHVRRGKLAPENVGLYLQKKRAKQALYLSNTVKELRRYFTGFEAKDGYSLSDLKRWPAARVEQVLRYGPHLHQLQSQKFVRVVPKSDAEREALTAFTGQRYRGSKKQKAFVIPVDHPDRTEVKYNKKTKKVQIVEKFKGGTTTQEFYFFRDYGYGPFTTWSQLIKAVKSMVGTKKRPGVLPAGSYTLWSKKNGTIFLPMPLQDIVLNLNYRFAQYKEEFADDILGFRYFKDELTAEQQYIEQAQFRRSAQKRKEQRRKDFEKQLRATKKKPSKKK